VRTWIAIFVLALAAMLLVSNASGTIGNLDSNTFGYLARGVALLIFVGGGSSPAIAAMPATYFATPSRGRLSGSRSSRSILIATSCCRSQAGSPAS
jgi:hypothetical protein